MVSLLVCYICSVAMELKASRAVVPCMVYGDDVLVHYCDTKQKGRPYLLVIQRLGNRSITITAKNAVTAPKDFGSIFIRGRVLIAASHFQAPFGTLFAEAIDEVEYVSAERVCAGKWVFVHPNGEPVNYPPQEDRSLMWQRHMEVALERWPGAPEYFHTAVAPDGKRDLLAFDLILTNPEEGKPTPPPRIAVTRIVPEVRARTGGGPGGNDGKPEVKHEENITSTIEEPFQAYVIGADYYFVTKSGEVYISVRTKKGRDRVTVKWDAAMPRVAYVISDSERPGVHFLITARDKAGWHYLRLGPGPKEHLLSDKGPYPEGKEPVEVLRELAELLKAKKLIGEAR